MGFREKNINSRWSTHPQGRSFYSIPPDSQVSVMWPKLNLLNTHPKTLNCESVKRDCIITMGMRIIEAAASGVSRNSAGKAAAAPGACPLRWDTAHSFLKPPMSSLHPVNKSPSVPTKSRLSFWHVHLLPPDQQVNLNPWTLLLKIIWEDADFHIITMSTGKSGASPFLAKCI